MSLWDQLKRLFSRSARMRAEIQQVAEALDGFDAELKSLQREVDGQRAYERRRQHQS